MLRGGNKDNNGALKAKLRDNHGTKAGEYPITMDEMISMMNDNYKNHANLAPMVGTPLHEPVMCKQPRRTLPPSPPNSKQVRLVHVHPFADPKPLV